MSAVWLFLRRTRLGRAVLVAAVAMTVIGGLWLTAWTQVRDSILQQQLERAVKAWETRNEIETDIDRLDDAGLCIELGGLPDDCAR